jgi:hypothetical protein
MHTTFAGLRIALLSVGTLLAFKATDAKAEKFQPIKEAEMPSGFPGYTPVGEIEVKKYPAYRKASASGGAEFWTLFAHIKSNNIEMSAPVEMDYGDPKAEKPAERSMAFLYGSKDQGKTGKQGDVTVVDVPAMTVVSIGCRGSRTKSAVAEARQKVLKYVDAHKEKYTIAGPLRVLGYNSPFVPREKNFFEVQVPVKATESGSGNDSEKKDQKGAQKEPASGVSKTTAKH